MSSKHRLLIRNAKQIVQVTKNGELSLKGQQQMNNIAILQGTPEMGVSLAVDRNGMILDLGCDNDLKKKYADSDFESVLDATGCCVLPGLIDAHTHPVWSGDRVHEFSMKLAGASYLEIHNAGGGIHFTVDKTAEASDAELLQSLLVRLGYMIRYGTTLTEAKSGYGLTMESEIRLLRIIEMARNKTSLEISSTFCGAHAVPRGLSMERATELVLKEQLPAIASLKDKGELQVENIDVFCESGVFDVDSSRRILEAGKRAGLHLNFHAEELSYIRGVEMGAALNARAMSHLECISDEGIQAMSNSGSVAVILPTTAFVLKITPPPVRKMIEKGVVVALGSDFNPNAYCLAMPTVMHLACIVCNISLPEALCAATINAAASLGRSRTHGSLEVGKQADLLIIQAPRWEHLIYQLGCHDRIIKYVIKKGKVVYLSPA